MIKANGFRAFLIAIFLWGMILSPFSAAAPASVQAQSGGVVWEVPQNISNLPTNSAYPTLVADSNGLVHVFWAENFAEDSAFNNAIYYARLANRTWTRPIDILIAPQGINAMADQPSAVAGPGDLLHVVFVSGWTGQIYHSSAPIDQALDVRAWKHPALISTEIHSAGSPTILVDKEERLHVVFQSGMGSRQGIYHVVSEDDGETWSYPDLIPGTPLGSSYVLTDTRADISPNGVLHVAWSWTSTELYPPKGIYYVRSDPFGTRWEEPQRVADGPYNYPDVFARNDDEIFMTWSGTLEDRFKFFRLSTNGGRNWSRTEKIPELGGFQGYSGMAMDSLGRVHLGMAATHYSAPIGGKLSRVDALIHSEWNGQAWSYPEPLLINTIDENNLQYSDVVITEGNNIHMVLMYPVKTNVNSDSGQQAYQFEIYYVRGSLGTPRIEPQPRAGQAPVTNETLQTPTSTPLPVERESVPTPLAEIVEYMPKNIVTIPGTMGIAAIPVALIFLIILGARRWGQK